MRFIYPVDLSDDGADGYLAIVPDVTGCATDGATEHEVLREIADALEEALAAAMIAKEDIPTPSSAKGRPTVTLGTLMATKAALYITMRETGTSNTALAAKMGLAETEVRRMLDPRHATKIGRLEAALALLGRRISVVVEAA
ncbi:type II toxin-antitoxin system HicB family antitoxin [Thalassospira sp. A40-3]|uniref:type II toxin-antitoxin system HicB family antitoxin n=1 Tax=Thalassospira sp. A40-3 TaxID=2785908 RepID=UPI0018CFA47A|nr:type II toxin-antitoxin system HicB family antitoxin [Thalassospira sp. A40-3]QPO13172.1 type II toxin-antitoxin system HicB family antitoxin [Thalassospira sp. A40-3]